MTWNVWFQSEKKCETLFKNTFLLANVYRARFSFQLMIEVNWATLHSSNEIELLSTKEKLLYRNIKQRRIKF